MTENTLKNFRGTPGPYTANFAKYSGQVAGFHITGPEHGSIVPVCDAGPARADMRPEELEYNARLLAASYEMAVFIQKVIWEFENGDLVTEEPTHAVTLRDEAQSILSKIIGDRP